MNILAATLTELCELFEIELLAEPGLSIGRLRDHRHWTGDDSDQLIVLRDIGVGVSVTAAVLGHGVETVRRWDKVLRPVRVPAVIIPCHK